MKCPKCGYLGFETVDRCRNCGYDFSLSPPIAIPELPLRSGATEGSPLDDLSLIDAATSLVDSPPPPGPSSELDRLFGPEPKAAAPPTGELSLFGSPIPDDQPLITRPSAPRAPLAVRRATPEAPRLRTEPRSESLGLLEFDAGTGTDAAPRRGRGERAGQRGGPAPRADEPVEDAGIGARLMAVLIDLAILAVIDAAVVYLTVQICGLSFDDLRIVPKAPLLTFLIGQNGGYLVAFTAGGQTLGKMAAGVRIVPADAREALDLGRAFVRTLMWVVLAVPAGLGFLTALFSRDHRGLHDRFAGTRVVVR